MIFDKKDIQKIVPEIQKAVEELNLEYYGYGNTIIYKYVSFDTLLKILLNNSLFFNTADNFNDPFDLYVDLIDFQYNQKHFKTVVNNHKDISRLYRRERRNLYTLGNKKRVKKTIIPEFKEGFQKVRSTFGICCFSKTPFNTLMWSHYADYHKGVCLGFNFQLPKDFYMLAVKYTSKIEPINYFRFRVKALINCYFTKSIAWEYEQEVRAINIQTNGFFHFNKESLKEIYLGLKFDKTKLDELNFVLEKNGYTSINLKQQMINVPTTFDIKPIDL